MNRAALDKITDKVLSYRKKQKPKPAKRMAASDVNRKATRKNKASSKEKALV